MSKAIDRTITFLPPGPRGDDYDEDDNFKRIEAAREALDCFAGTALFTEAETGDTRLVLTDLLADLMHLADAELGPDAFVGILSRALMHYEYERAPKRAMGKG
jgi:hypothetical protein